MNNLGLQAYYDRFEAAKRAVRAANRLGKEERSRAFSLFNKHRAELKRIQSGKKPLHHFGTPDIIADVFGIPCGIVFDGYLASGGYWVTDKNGYEAKWITNKITNKEKYRLDDLVYDYIRKQEEWILAM